MVKDSGYMMNSSLEWCAGFVGVAGGRVDLPGMFGAKNNAVLRRRENFLSSFALATFRTLPLGRSSVSCVMTPSSFAKRSCPPSTW